MPPALFIFFRRISLAILNLLWFHINFRKWQPTPVLLPGKPHGRRSLVGCSPWGREESDTTEQLPFHFSLSCIGEGNGNPLQCSCLENRRDGGVWWAAICGVAQSQTRLKRLSSSSSSFQQSTLSLQSGNQMAREGGMRASLGGMKEGVPKSDRGCTRPPLLLLRGLVDRKGHSPPRRRLPHNEED